METPKTLAGELTEKIMEAMSNHIGEPTTQAYNRTYEAVLQILTDEFAREVYSRQQAVELVYYWQYQQGDSLACSLFPLFAKMDHLNLHRARLAWPNLVGAWEEWRASDQKAWLRKYNFDESKA